jgi:hypothetical protein
MDLDDDDCSTIVHALRTAATVYDKQGAAHEATQQPVFGEACYVEARAARRLAERIDVTRALVARRLAAQLDEGKQHA